MYSAHSFSGLMRRQLNM